jgi:exopolyphosphatase/guanosine-5'-triphosphate,3'-diphosphate pyrophosphatase
MEHSTDPREAAQAEVLSFMQSLEQRPAHVEHVSRLALMLFDELSGLHGYGSPERALLNAAAHLHDIGHHSGKDGKGGGHHKESARLIRQHSWKYFRPHEVEIIAQVCRYHRKAIPELSHEEFSKLSPSDRRIVQCLTCLLRLADGLDKTHSHRVAGVTVEVRPNQLVFHLEAAGPVAREVCAAHKKGDLACAFFQRDLVFMVGSEIVPASPNE